MNYLELNCIVFPPRFSEIVIALLSDYGFESFADTEKGFSAYIPEKNFDIATFEALEIFSNKEIRITYALNKIPEQNWNAIWETNFEPVLIGSECYIRAPFHPVLAGIRYEIIIEPKMSFGTGHHETTHMMSVLLMEQNVCGKDVLDMGCGTAVLAILAKKMGASEVMAVDNDEWAFSNAIENIERNHVSEIRVMHGDAALIGAQQFDLILANINRNVLLSDIPAYASALKKGGTLLLSGFYESDVLQINQKTEQCGLHHERYITMNSWCASVYSNR